jgi:hypothetical protein
VRTKRVAWIVVFALIIGACSETHHSGAPQNHETPTTAIARVSPPANGKLHGTLRMVGGPVGAGGRPADDLSVSGVVTFVGLSGRRWRTRASASRGFGLSLLPGVYRVTGASPKFDNGAPLCGARKVTVAPKQTTEVQVVCPVD